MSRMNTNIDMTDPDEVAAYARMLKEQKFLKEHSRKKAEMLHDIEKAKAAGQNIDPNLEQMVASGVLNDPNVQEASRRINRGFREAAQVDGIRSDRVAPRELSQQFGDQARLYGIPADRAMEGVARLEGMEAPTSDLTGLRFDPNNAFAQMERGRVDAIRARQDEIARAMTEGESRRLRGIPVEVEQAQLQSDMGRYMADRGVDIANIKADAGIKEAEIGSTTALTMDERRQQLQLAVLNATTESERDQRRHELSMFDKIMQETAAQRESDKEIKMQGLSNERDIAEMAHALGMREIDLRQFIAEGTWKDAAAQREMADRLNIRESDLAVLLAKIQAQSGMDQATIAAQVERERIASAERIAKAGYDVEHIRIATDADTEKFKAELAARLGISTNEANVLISRIQGKAAVDVAGVDLAKVLAEIDATLKMEETSRADNAMSVITSLLSNTDEDGNIKASMSNFDLWDSKLMAASPLRYLLDTVGLVGSTRENEMELAKAVSYATSLQGPERRRAISLINQHIDAEVNALQSGARRSLSSPRKSAVKDRLKTLNRIRSSIPTE